MMLNNCEDWKTKALYYIAKLKTKQKNFYEAQYTLNRIYNEIAYPKINDFIVLIDAVFVFIIIDIIINKT